MSGKLEPESVPCTHETVLFHRTTFHVTCADCKEVLAEPPVKAVAAEEAPCPHLMLTTDATTHLTSCLLCKEVLTKETYIDSSGEVRGMVDDAANMRALPKYLFDPSFQGAQTGGVASYSYEEAYRGEDNQEWNPNSGAPCPHFLKTTSVKTGKVTCSMCNQEVPA